MHGDKAPRIHTLQLQCPRVHTRTGTSTLPAAPLGAPSTHRGSRSAGGGDEGRSPPHTHTHTLAPMQAGEEESVGAALCCANKRRRIKQALGAGAEPGGDLPTHPHNGWESWRSPPPSLHRRRAPQNNPAAGGDAPQVPLLAWA